MGHASLLIFCVPRPWLNQFTICFFVVQTLKCVLLHSIDFAIYTLKSTSVSVCFRGISRLPSAFIFLQWFKLAHISIQVCTFHDGSKQGIDQKIFNRKSISCKITHLNRGPQRLAAHPWLTIFLYRCQSFHHVLLFSWRNFQPLASAS